MNAMSWILVGALTGGLTGIFLAEKGYGKVLSRGCTSSLDIFFGIVGASIVHSILFWALIGNPTPLDHYGTAFIGAIALVGTCRRVSERYFRSPTYRGMSRAAYLQWQDNLIVKELASWKPRRKPQAKSPSA